MYFQQRYLEQGRAFTGLVGMDTVDLPNEGMLSGIAFQIWGSNGNSVADPDVWLHDRLTRIEVVVNGSQVVKSYSGEQLLALMHYKKTLSKSGESKNMNAAACEETFYINFGRHYHDPDYCLDLSKVRDPELRFTYNFSMTVHHGWTNGTAMTAAPSRNVVPHIMRDFDHAVKGYIKTSELYRATTAAALHENMMIARGPVYSNLYFQSFYAGLGIGMTVDHLELNYNMSDLIPMRLAPNELAEDNLRKYGLVQGLDQEFTITGAQAYPFPIDQGFHDGMCGPGVNALITTGNLWANTMPTSYTVISTNAAGAGQIHAWLHFWGVWPFSMVAIPGFDPWDERTWMDTKKYGDVMLRAELTAGAGVANTIKLLGDEVVTSYPS